MGDRISHYRQARFVMQIPPNLKGRSYFSLHAVGVRKGIPTATILVDGYVAPLAQNCTTEELLEAYEAALAQSMLH